MTNCLRHICCGAALMITTMFPAVSSVKGETVVLEDIRHMDVFREAGRFAGWPANNGIWQWGEEILVGLTLGYLAPPEKQGLHQLDSQRPLSSMLARSPDGGETWSVG